MSAALADPEHDLKTLDDACGKAVDYHLAGHTDLAEQVYRAILGAQGDHAGAGYGLAMLLLMRGDTRTALTLLGALVDRHPGISEFRLGWLEALLKVDHPEVARDELAAARAAGHGGAEFDAFERRLPPPPGWRPGTVGEQKGEMARLVADGRLEEACEVARRLTHRAPTDGLGWKFYGALLWNARRDPAAVPVLERSLRMMPQDAETWVNLGKIRIATGEYTRGEECFRRAVALQPQAAAAHEGLGFALLMQRRVDEAEPALIEAVRCAPTLSSPLNNLGALYAEMGDSVRAAEVFRKAIELAPDDATGWSALLFLLTHMPDLSAGQLFEEHLRFGRHFEPALRETWQPHDNVPDPERTLRVGIVSGDLYHHAVKYFIDPLLPELARQPGIELHAYYNHDLVDGSTLGLVPRFRRWTQVAGMSDEALAERIRSDGIDILIDLSGHTLRNRLLTFARRPAPVQASWIGYPGTTGLGAMDYYIGDPALVPHGDFDQQFTEKLVRLPSSVPFLSFNTGIPAGPLPALRGQGITFASFNRSIKINQPTVALWSRVLAALPDARLIFAHVTDSASQARFTGWLREAGADLGRIEFRGRVPFRDYLQMHNEIDVCLDTFPYTGGTTTYHAITMGVPTLTLAGNTVVTRQGASVMTHFGVQEFIASSPDQLVEIARSLPDRLDHLAALRAELPQRWQAMTEIHPDQVAARLAEAWRLMWQRWCRGEAPAPITLTGE